MCLIVKSVLDIRQIEGRRFNVTVLICVGFIVYGNVAINRMTDKL